MLSSSHTSAETKRRALRPPWNLTVRGGAVARRASSSSSSDDESSSSLSPSSQNKHKPAKTKLVLGTIVTLTLGALAYNYRSSLRTLFDKDHLQKTVLGLLHAIEQEEGSHGILLYVLGMAFWELLGMSTIPVETAAGMAFGWRRGFVGSAAGKLLGALSAYALGKSVLHETVRRRLADNKILKLIDGSVARAPLRVAFLMRYSLIPELVKNCGAALFSEIRPWMFVLSVVGHGWLYTAVWTLLGADTARRLEHPPHDEIPFLNRWYVQASVVAATVVGTVVTPLLMAWWVRDMQESQLNTIEKEDMSDE